MASPPFVDRNAILQANVSHLVGASVDAATFVPESGLLVLSLYVEHRTFVAFGVGPIASEVGLVATLPQGAASNDAPIVSALRAHLVGKKIHSLQLDLPAVILSASAQDGSESADRLFVNVGRRGFIRVVGANGTVVSWPMHVSEKPAKLNDASIDIPNSELSTSLEDAGARMLQSSDSFVVESLRRNIVRAVDKKQKRLERRANAIVADLARLDDVPRLQKVGSLLISQCHSIPRKATKVALMDWETGESIEIDLAPAISPKEHAAALFQKARRLQRGAAIMQKRLDDTRAAVTALLPFALAARDAPADYKSLQNLAKQCIGAGIAIETESAPRVTGQDRHAIVDRKPYHIFHAACGRPIWVGRSSKDNDALVTRIARPHDLWLHAKNTRGAHVVVPLDKNHPCPADVLVDAATLAAHFSDARKDAVCEVSYVERRYVRKPRKAAPGQVLVDREKVIVVRIEKDRLSRLLASKQES